MLKVASTVKYETSSELLHINRVAQKFSLWYNKIKKRNNMIEIFTAHREQISDLINPSVILISYWTGRLFIRWLKRPKEKKPRSLVIKFEMKWKY